MDLLADQQAGKGGEIQLTDAWPVRLDREAMYAVVIDPLSGYDTGTPSGWMATNALMAANDPACRCLLGRHRRARRIDAQVSLRASTFTGVDLGSRPFFIRAAIAGSLFTENI